MSGLIKHFNIVNKPVIIDSSSNFVHSEAGSILVKYRQELEELEKLISEKKSEAEKILEEARKKAEQMLEQAERDISLKMAAASEEAEEAKRKAMIEGREAGLAQGRKEGLEQVRETMKKAENVLTEALKKKDSIILRSEGQIVELVMLVAKKVIHEELKQTPELVLRAVEEALKLVVDRDNVTIHLNTSDLHRFEAGRKELLRSFPPTSRVKVIEDQSVEPGGVVISTSMGNIDARISSKLFEIDRAFSEVVDEQGRR